MALYICFCIQGDVEGMCAFLAYFIMSGFQFRQAHAVVQKIVSAPLHTYVHIKWGCMHIKGGGLVRVLS